MRTPYSLFTTCSDLYEKSTFMQFFNVLRSLLLCRISTGSNPCSQPSKFTFTHNTSAPDDGDRVSETSDTQFHMDMAHQGAVNLLITLDSTVIFGFGTHNHNFARSKASSVFLNGASSTTGGGGGSATFCWLITLKYLKTELLPLSKHTPARLHNKG
jgi:hypothetical protein